MEFRRSTFVHAPSILSHFRQIVNSQNKQNFEQFSLLKTLFQFIQVSFNFLACCVFKQESQNLVVAGGGGALLANDNLFHGINSFLLDCLYYSTGWRESQDPFYRVLLSETKYFPLYFSTMSLTMRL